MRYRITAERRPTTYACHCTICQCMSGSSFALQMPVAETALSVEGEIVERSRLNHHGATARTRYCRNCLTRIFNSNDQRPGLVVVRAGTLDGSEQLAPSLHIYVSTKQPWLTLPDGIPVFEENAPMPVWMELLAS